MSNVDTTEVLYGHLVESMHGPLWAQTSWHARMQVILFIISRAETLGRPPNFRWGTAHASVPQYFENGCSLNILDAWQSTK